MRTRHGNGVEVLGSGKRFVASGIHPDTQRTYEWPKDADPFNTALEDLPAVTQDDIDGLMAAIESRFGKPTRNRQTRPASEARETVKDPATGLIVDGRDRYLFDLICGAAGSHDGAEAIADAAWEQFVNTVDLSVPKGGAGLRCWTRDDALAKARYFKSSGYKPKCKEE